MAAPSLASPLPGDLRDPLFQALPASTCRLCVVVPVRDEAATLGATLESFARQRQRDGSPLNPALFEILLLANNCRDASAAIARRFAAAHPELRLHIVERELPEPHAHVGYARRLLMDEAARRLLSTGRSRGAIASTDADTRVDTTWIAATLAEIDGGADVVGGRIFVDSDDLRQSPDARLLHLQDVTYRWLATQLDARIDPDPFDPWPRHFQHFGASIAVTVEAYRRAGGMPIQPWLEDVAFAAALSRAGCRVRHSPLVRVVTSGRRRGRATFGYAAQLVIWEAMQKRGQPFLVEPVEAIVARAHTRRRLRGLWWRTDRNQGMTEVAADLGVSATWLASQLGEQPSFGALTEAFGVPAIATGSVDERWPLVEISQAIRCLRERLGTAGVSAPLPLEHVEPPGLLAAAG
jgi:hypothetical protein